MDKSQIKTTLTELVQRDIAHREKLISEGRLSDGYDEEMEQIHIENARHLQQVMKDIGGWPVGEMYDSESEEAAWLIAQHAISLPDFQREVLQILRNLSTQSTRRLQRLAMMEDRVRVFEGRDQLYGTNFDWNTEGQLMPTPIEDPEMLDERRAKMGLKPIEQEIQHFGRSKDRPPKDREYKARQFEQWLAKVGWRK